MKKQQMATGHMLPYPFMDMPVGLEDMRALQSDVVSRGPGMSTLQTVMIHLIQRVLIGMAAQAHGKKAAGDKCFRFGAALVAHDWTTRSLADIEREILVPMLGLEGEGDVIFEEIAAFGKKALEHGELGADGVLRF